MVEQTLEATREQFYRFRDRIHAKTHSVERVRGFLAALKAMEKKEPLTTSEELLVYDLHLCCFQFCSSAWNPENEMGWTLWLYADYRRQLRQAICLTYDISPVAEIRHG